MATPTPARVAIQALLDFMLDPSTDLDEDDTRDLHYTLGLLDEYDTD